MTFHQRRREVLVEKIRTTIFANGALNPFHEWQTFYQLSLCNEKPVTLIRRMVQSKVIKLHSNVVNALLSYPN